MEITPNIDVSNLAPRVRKLSDMKEVIYDRDWLESALDEDLYYMYGDVLQNNAFGYSITILLPKMLGKEFNKTKGHAHVGDFKETYTVLEGEAIYLMQKTSGEVVEDVYAVKAKTGDSIIIPVGYGHVSINPSGNNLKTGDWRVEGVKGDYSLFEKMHGACYYYTKEGWVANQNYKNVPPLRFEEPLKEIPKDLSCLK